MAAVDSPLSERKQDGRRINGWLWVGLIVIPWATVWFLYRDGYSFRARVLATLWFSVWLWAKSGCGPTMDAYVHRRLHGYPWYTHYVEH